MLATMSSRGPTLVLVLGHLVVFAIWHLPLVDDALDESIPESVFSEYVATELTLADESGLALVGLFTSES